MRLLITGLALALMTTGALAQAGQMGPGSNIGQNAEAAAAKGDKADAAKAKANEKAYNAALQNVPNKQYDPWHGVR